MVKIAVGLLTLGLVAYIGYNQLGTAPLDSRQSIEAGISEIKKSANLSPEQEQLLKVQLALADFTAISGHPPDQLSDLVPKYFDTTPKNPQSGDPLKYQRNGNEYKLGAQTDSVESTTSASSSTTASAGKGSELDAEIRVGEEEFVNPNTLEMDTVAYDPAGRRDPFRPFDFAPQDETDTSMPPLQRYSLGQLKITAILADSRNEEYTAIVEDATGKGYPVRKGTLIGSRNGVVVSIEPDRINVIETMIDFTGKETKTPVVMKIPPRGAQAAGNLR